MVDRRRQSGFVLLMTLALVVLAAITLAGLARRSMSTAVEAQTSLEQLQHRWAVTTAEATLLPRLAWILRTAERGGEAAEAMDSQEQEESYENDPLPHLRKTCRLAGVNYTFVITDEQSKLNVNQLLETGGRTDAEATIDTLLRDNALPRRGLRLRPAVVARGASANEAGLPDIGGYGQVFGDVTPETLVGEQDADAGCAVNITCWGSGRVNLHRASPAVIRAVCEERVGPIVTNQLLNARAQHPHRKLPTLLADIDTISFDDKKKLTRILTDESTCYGLWTIAENQQRTRHSLAVAVTAARVQTDGEPEPEEQDIVQTYRFAW